MGGSVEPALLVVRGDGGSEGALPRCAPAHEVSTARDQLLKARAILEVIAIAEKDYAVRLAAVLIFNVPVGRELLDGDQQIVAQLCTAPDHGTDQRQIERIEQRRSR